MPTRPTFFAVVAFVLAPLAAHASAYTDRIEEAAYSVHDARNALRKAPQACRDVLTTNLKKLAGELADLRDEQSDLKLENALASIAGVVVAEDIGACPETVTSPVAHAQKALTQAREVLVSARVAAVTRKK